MSGSERPGFVTAVISPVVCGVVRLWHGDGSVLLSVDDPGGLSALLGRAEVPRTQVGDGNTYREVCQVDLAAGLLGVVGRFDADGETGVRLFGVSAATERPEGDPWADVAAWLASVVPAAAERGEYVALETGGTAYQARPYVTFSVHERDGARITVVEADPAPPVGTPIWSDAEPPAEGPASVTGPASRRTVDAAAPLMAVAASAWANPWRLSVSFGTQPAGPFLLGDGAGAPPPA